MLDKVGHSSGKIYLNGTVVIHAATPGNLSDRFGDSRNRSERVYKLNFKSKQKLFDAITYQNYMAGHDPHLYHSFLTLTFKRGFVPVNPNEAVTSFFSDWKKRHGLENYTWVREVGARGNLPHYHVTVVAARRSVAAINRSWSTARGYYTSNAVRTAPGRGMVINNLASARRYVAKYMTKCEETQAVKLPGRIYGVSNNLQFEPLTIDSTFAAGLIHDPWYSEGRIYHGDFSTVGYLQPFKSVTLFEEIQSEVLKERERRENADRARRLRDEQLKKIAAQKRLQLELI